MDSTFISAAVQITWNEWNIRGFMILSLCMQLVLALTAPFRRKTSNGFFIIVVWSAYLLADWAALFAFGLISNATSRRNSNNNGKVAPDVMAFWAAFLLIHLGGPDTITAFSLEDNALWLRHLVGLIAQLFVFLYIFVKTLPQNKLLVPTTLIFMAGVIKYGERTRALYLASLENLKKSVKKTTSIIEYQYAEYIFNSFHEISKGFIVDITPDLTECNKIRDVLLTRGYDWTIQMIFWELRLLYEVLYTKIKGANSGWGTFARSIAYYSTLAAFILFCLAYKQEFHGVDIAITYALLGGFFILHVSNLLMLLTSQVKNDDIRTQTWKEFILLIIAQGFLPSLLVSALRLVRNFLVQDLAIEYFFVRQWPKKMGSFNLLSHCFKQGATTQCQKPGFIWNKLAEMRHTSLKNFDPKLCVFVFKDLKRKTEVTFDKERLRKVYEARGDWALEGRGCHELKPYIKDFRYDNTLFIWHVATEICYNIEEGDTGDGDEVKRLSKVLSDYMMYLLVRQPKLMSAVAGIAHIRYEETCVALKLLRSNFSVLNMQSFCVKILEEHDDITKPTDEGHLCALSVLKDSCRLVRLIREENNRWEVIFNVWIELLSYAASHCRTDSHARLLSEGGEFITFVWMLMAYFGVGA